VIRIDSAAASEEDVVKQQLTRDILLPYPI